MSPPHGDRSLHQRIAWGRTSRAPLREMTIEGVVMLAIGIPIRAAAGVVRLSFSVGSFPYMRRSGGSGGRGAPCGSCRISEGSQGLF